MPRASNYLPQVSNAGGNYTRIKCQSCKRVKNREAFSDNQINILDARIQRSSKPIDPAVAQIVNCVECSGETRIRVELKCADCDRTKTIDAFNKTQRRMGEDARCEACIYGRTAESSSDDDDSSGGSQSDQTETANSADEDENSGGVSVVGATSLAGSTNPRSGATAFSGHDVQSVAALSNNGSSIAATSSYAGSDAGSVASASPSRGFQRAASPAWSTVSTSAVSTTSTSALRVAPHRRRQFA